MNAEVVLLFISSLTCLWIVPSDCLALHGKYSDEVISGSLVIPRKVNRKGELISHNLTHHHSHPDASEDLHYHIDLNNETLHLELEPHTYFMAPNVVVERHKRDLRIRRKLPKNLTHCHYHGKIRNHHNSKVAISSCDGLVGHIRVKNAEYYIEPSKHHPPSALDGHAHVIFQRSSVKEKKTTKGRWKGKKKPPPVSNCGTKEPRRRTETRIEWHTQGKVIVQGGKKIRRHQHNHRNRHNREHFGTNANRRRRARRSVSSPRHVETLLVADPTMVAFHENVETYLLTIMNVVSSLYKDPSIGNSIEIVVVKIVLLDEEEAHPDLALDENAQRNLHSFCAWQHKMNTASKSEPNHHDVAILVTRTDICGSDCMTLGLANVGGMCKPRKSCSVNEDNGIQLSHTIAHELGHNFGMYHDTMKIGCHGREGPIVHIMIPNFLAETLQVSWSNCSRKYITNFLDQGLGKCLDDKPHQKEYSYPSLPPGAMYNAELQCRLQYNLTDDVHVCSAPNEICSILWCQVNGECVTNMRPPAPGTACGKHKWCQNGQCVTIEDEVPPLNGGWGNWSEWSKCSRSCGGGVSTQNRECNNPVPANGGLFCIGERRRYRICNVDTCPEGEPSFRAQQCSQFDNMTYEGAKYKWLPYFNKHNPCKLYCTDTDDMVIANWKDVVDDGTPCEIGTKNMCIDGLCKKVSCDWVVDSDREEDRCGICGGDDEDCEPIKRIFSDSFNETEGYFEIATIPARSRHIVIKELGNSPHFLSIGKTNTSKYYLNGNRLISMPGELIIAGAESFYDREDDKELIFIPKAIDHSITLYAIVRRDADNEGIYYEYTLPVLDSSPVEKNYTWALGDWTACSATCGGGVQFRMPLCFERKSVITDDEELCYSNAPNERPKTISRSCNEIPCSTYWWTGLWQLCPVSCQIDGDPEPVKHRSILCMDQFENVLPEHRCNSSLRPHDVEPCGSVPLCTSDIRNEISD